MGMEILAAGPGATVAVAAKSVTASDSVVSRKTEIRFLDIRDLSRLGPLVRSFAKESRLQEQFNARIDVSHFMGTVETLMKSGVGEGIIAEEEGRFIGMVLYVITPHLFTGLKTLTESAWYVFPEVRNSSTGVRLFKAMEQRAKEAGVEIIIMIHLQNLQPEELKGFYEGQGYQLTENSYVKRI